MWLPPPLPRTLEAALRDLGSDKAEVRASAAADLVRCVQREPEVRERATQALSRALEDEAAAVRARAAEGLADLRAEEGVRALLLRIEDDDVQVRQMAITALGEIGDVSALPRLRRALSDRRPEVRFQAVVAFTRLCEDEEDCAEALIGATRDDDDEVRLIAVRAAEDRFRKSAPARLRDAIAGLLRGAHDVANAAAIFLCRAGDARGEERVLAVVGGSIASNKEDERGAIEVAGERRLIAARAVLERRAFGLRRHFADTCAFHAKVALAQLGDARAIAEIVGDLRALSQDKRQAAVVACGRARIREAKEKIAAMKDVDPTLRAEALAALEEGA